MRPVTVAGRGRWPSDRPRSQARPGIPEQVRLALASLAALSLAVVPLAAVPVAAAPAAGATTAAGERYVALGDSYAAGLGIGALDTSAGAEACGRSAQDYPHQLAAALDLQLTDVTCSGAVTSDLAGSQDAGRTAVPPQFDALTADTRLVTLTIGGNDLGFSAIAGYCASLSGPNGPVRGGDGQAADCEAHYVSGGDDTLADDLRDTVGPDLTAALATIRDRAPDAAVVLVDYPALVPDAANTPSAGCWASPLQRSDALPFTDTDLPYLQQTQARLDQLLADTATAAGARVGVATTYTASLAHTACSSSPWVNGVRLQGLSVASSSLHPNLTGATAMAQAAVPVARTLLAGGTVDPPADVADAAAGPGIPGWVWAAVAVGVLLVALVAVGAFRVARRRRG